MKVASFFILFSFVFSCGLNQSHWNGQELLWSGSAGKISPPSHWSWSEVKNFRRTVEGEGVLPNCRLILFFLSSENIFQVEDGWQSIRIFMYWWKFPLYEQNGVSMILIEPFQVLQIRNLKIAFLMEYTVCRKKCML